MTDDPKKNRRSFRIAESAFVSCEAISELDVAQGMERWKMTQGSGVGVRSRLMEIDARLNEKIFLLKSDSVALAECMSLLNQKITSLVDELPGMRESRASLSQQSPQHCEISADGMFFGTDTRHSKDANLMLRFLLTTDNRYIETFCKVVRVSDPPSEDGQRFSHGVAVEFLNMKPEQKEILIQHMFDRESETLRMRRLQLDTDELDKIAGQH